MSAAASPGSGRPALSPWRFIVLFGVVSLLADMVYEGARSIIGPYLATLGASAVLVGVVAGAGEFIGYALRVVTGYAVVRTRRYWTWTILGYALTVLSVPLIGVTGALAPALLLYGTERLGKAVRSPAKDTLLSYASATTGRGSAFGVHQALDQTGAVLGPLLLAVVLSWREGDYASAFGVLVVPGALVLGLLFWLRRRVPDPARYETPTRGMHDVGGVPSAASAADAEGHATGAGAGAGARADADAAAVEDADPVDDARADARRLRLPARFWLYAAAIGLLSGGVASFPLLAYHARTTGLLADAQVPLLFAAAMLVDGASGLLVGRAYDRFGPRTLLLVSVAAVVSSIAFADDVVLVWVGVAVWGVVNGVLDSTAKAVVTDLVPSAARAIAFGWLAFVRGAALLAAGALLGLAYDLGTVAVVVVIAVANAGGLVGLALVLRRLGR